MLFLSAVAEAAPSNQTLSFSARLKNSTGSVVADGYYNIGFRLYTADSGGTPVWTEIYHDSNGPIADGDNRLKVVNGYFSVKLGSLQAFENVDWNGDLWMTMNIGGTSQVADTGSIAWDGEMNPRIQLSAVPYAMTAMNAQTLGGRSADEFLQVGSGMQDAGSDASIAINKTGSGDLIQLQSSGAEAFTLHSTGSMTLGSTSSQSISVADSSTGAGQSLTLAAGSSTTGDSDGGDLVLQAGDGSGTGADGDIIVASNLNVGAGQTITMVGGATSLRPASPEAGTIYFDTDTQELLVFAGSEWQVLNNSGGDGKAATMIVAASDSSQSAKDGTDYVADGEAVAGSATLDGDQVEINAAIDALPASGGHVYLSAGTYYLDGSIVLPDNVTLAGAGAGTILTVSSPSQSIHMVTNSDSINGNTDITVRDIRFEGNRAGDNLQLTYGIVFTSVGPGNGAGATITNNRFNDMRGDMIRLNTSSRTSILNNTFTNGAREGITSINGTNLQINHNSFDNMDKAIELDSTDETIFSNNVVTRMVGGGNGAIHLINGSNSNTIGNNILRDNPNISLRIASSSHNIVTKNHFINNGGTSNSSHIELAGSTTNNIISDNKFHDNEGDGHSVSISSGANETLVSGNSLYGPGADSIGDGSSTTIYDNQMDGSGKLITRSSGGFGVQDSSGTDVLEVDGSTGSVNIAGTLDTTTDTALNIGTGNATSINLGTDTLVKGSTDSTNAFQVQNTAGGSVLNVNTESNSVSTGTLSLASDSLSGSTGMGDAVSLWSSTPTGTALSDREFSVNVGLVFQSSVAGYVTGVRYYNPDGNNAAGSDIGQLWACSQSSCAPGSGGSSLASVTFPSDTSSGWKTATFSTPVLVSPDTNYMVTYYSQQGMYYATSGYFNSQDYTNGPLTVPQDNDPTVRSSGFRFYSQSFPDTTFNGSNYWVDVAFREQTSGDNISTTEDLNISSQGKMTLNANDQALNLQGGNVNINGDTTIKGPDSTTALVVQNSNSDNVLAVDTINNRVSLGTSDTTGTLLVLDTKTNAGDPAGTNGAMYYNAAAGKFRCYQAGGWTDCITPLPVSKTVVTDMSVTDSAADVSDLGFDLAANTKYYYKFMIISDTSSTNTGIGFGVTTPTNPASSNWCVNTTATLASTAGTPGWGSYCGTNDVYTTTIGTDSPGNSYSSTMEGYIETGGDAGTLQLRGQSEDTNQSFIREGSFGILQIVQ